MYSAFINSFTVALHINSFTVALHSEVNTHLMALIATVLWQVVLLSFYTRDYEWIFIMKIDENYYVSCQ